MTWPRKYTDTVLGAIPYRDQAARVILQGETGAVQGLSLTFPTSQPAAATRSVTQAQATATAAAQLQTSGIDTPVLASAVLMVVEPNTFWTNGSGTPSGDGSAVAWDCRHTDASGTTHEVWVDAATNQVVGGETWAVRGTTMAPRPFKAPVKQHGKGTTAKPAGGSGRAPEQRHSRGSKPARRTHR